MKVVFFGSGAFGLPTLRALADRHDLVGIVTQPDRRAGRGGKTAPTPVGAWAVERALEVPLIKPERASVEPSLSEIRSIDADAWVVIAFGQKLSPSFLADRFSCNLHASLLPRWRGAAPINAAMVAGDTVTGNSVITLADRMDAGLVLGQSERSIQPDQTAGELHDLLAEDGPDLMLRVLEQHASGTLNPIEQDEGAVTIAPKMSKADGWVDFTRSADACRARIHGLTPWPGVTVQRVGPEGTASLKLLRVQAEAVDHEETAGALIDAAEGVIACGDGTLRLMEVQPSGKKPMSWRDYVNGRPFHEGERLQGLAEASA